MRGSSDSDYGQIPLAFIANRGQTHASVRFTARKNGEILYQSDWTDIEIEPFSEEKREEWLRSLEAKVNQRSVNDVVPSLLAWPDEKALAVLLKVIPADTSRCMNYDCVRLAFGRAALAGFDDALLRREIVTVPPTLGSIVYDSPRMSLRMLRTTSRRSAASKLSVTEGPDATAPGFGGGSSPPGSWPLRSWPVPL